MAANIHVGNVDALDQMERTLGNAQVEGSEALTAFRHGLQSEFDWITQLEEDARKAVWRAEDDLQSARDLLASVESAGDDEDPPDTYPYEEAVAENQHRLAQAEQRLTLVVGCSARIREASEAFAGESVRFEALLEGRVDGARSYLRAKHQELSRYLSMAAAGSSSRLGGSVGQNPSETIGSVSVAGARFRNLGMVAVPLDQIDFGEINVHGPSDFHKVPYETMRAGVARFDRDVRPAVERGAGKEFFEQQDQSAGVDYEHGLTRLYDAFYGTDSIRLDRVRGRHVPVNGQHRLFIARELGIPSLPANVTADENTP